MIVKERVPIDDGWHQFTVARILHVDHQDVGFVTFWWDSRPEGGEVTTRFYRVFATGQPVPFDAVWVGTTLDPRGPGRHLFSTTEVGVNSPPVRPVPPRGERPDENYPAKPFEAS